MQVASKIDHLIKELTELKPTLSADSSGNEKRFKDLLAASMKTGQTAENEEKEIPSIINVIPLDVIPSWVGQDYGYDPQNPRKPNMHELMEAISGKTLADLYAEPVENWQKISHQASEMLYGVVGEREDSRDWLSIMNSNDVLTEARKQTGAMYKPEVDIQSNFNDSGVLTEQVAVIKDNKGNSLRSLSSASFAEKTLLNFGATKESIPTDLEKRINPEKFDDELLAFLKSFDHSPNSVQQVVVQSATEVISNKLSQEIPIDELAKL